MAQTFEAFMRRIDEILEEKYGVTSMDLPDFPYHRRFDAGSSAATVARAAVKNAETY